jgi:hypothetical protein
MNTHVNRHCPVVVDTVALILLFLPAARIRWETD